jgi:hypothetical protein
MTIMDQPHTPDTIFTNIDDFLKNYPQLAESLRLFDMAYAQYQQATEQSYGYTDVSTSPSHHTFTSKDTML